MYLLVWIINCTRCTVRTPTQNHTELRSAITKSPCLMVKTDITHSVRHSLCPYIEGN